MIVSLTGSGAGTTVTLGLPVFLSMLGGKLAYSTSFMSQSPSDSWSLYVLMTCRSLCTFYLMLIAICLPGSRNPEILIGVVDRLPLIRLLKLELFMASLVFEGGIFSEF